MTTTPQPEYTPYGPEWEAELNRLPKAQLIAMLRRAYIDRDALRETLPYREKERDKWFKKRNAAREQKEGER